MAAESNHNQGYPPAPANCYPRSDGESLYDDQDEKRKKRMKLIIYITAFAVFQVIVIVMFSLVVMRVQRPKLRVDPIQIQTMTFRTLNPGASFDTNFIAPFRVKNTNFGPYKYDATNVTFSYGGVALGRVTIPKSKVNFKSTKKIDMTVSLNSSALVDTTSLGKELNRGFLTLTSQAKMTGKVELMLMFKKKKSTDMNCTMFIDILGKLIWDLTCK